MQKLNPDLWCVQDIIDKYERFAVPHFQRGLVWSDDLVASLLDSIYRHTPCGTILFWKPRSPEIEGDPLVRGGEGGVDLLLVDGQQRVRCLHDVFGTPANPGESTGFGSEEEDDDPGEATGTWCFNLARLPEIAPLIPESRFGLFRRIRDPLQTGRFLNHIPLHLLLSGNDDEIQRYIRSCKPGGSSAVMRLVQETDLMGRVRGLLRNRVFFCLTFVETDREHRLEDMILLYNRINSAGQPVKSEERAFATLVSVCKERANRWLAEVFEEIHPRSESGAARGLRRDAALSRIRERAFGFKLFMRTFVQACNYEFGRAAGSAGLSFEVMADENVQRQLRQSEQVTAKLLDRTRKVLVCSRRLLRELGCDDLQTLPDATCLQPLHQLLLRFPDLMESALDPYRPALHSLILRLLLHRFSSQRDAQALMKKVDGSHTARRCLEDLFRKEFMQVERVSDALARWLAESSSLQDRYVLLLYWLIRRRQARDLSYDNRSCAGLRAKYGRERLIDAQVSPEKQHIVPYSSLQVIYETEARGRITRHPCNNVGNLTYISSELNHFATGLGAHAADLSKEPVENLNAHLLADSTLQGLYSELTTSLAGPGRSRYRQLQETFEQFTRRRRELIAAAFREWLVDLSQRAEESLRDVPRVEPAGRAVGGIPDRIRDLQYGDDVEDALLALVSIEGVRRGPVPRGFDLRLRIPDALSVQDGKRRDVFLDFDRHSVTVRCQPKSGLFRDLERILLAKGRPPGSVPRHGDGPSAPLRIVGVGGDDTRPAARDYRLEIEGDAASSTCEIVAGLVELLRCGKEKIRGAG